MAGVKEVANRPHPHRACEQDSLGELPQDAGDDVRQHLALHQVPMLVCPGMSIVHLYDNQHDHLQHKEQLHYEIVWYFRVRSGRA